MDSRSLRRKASVEPSPKCKPLSRNLALRTPGTKSVADARPRALSREYGLAMCAVKTRNETQLESSASGATTLLQIIGGNADVAVIHEQEFVTRASGNIWARLLTLILVPRTCIAHDKFDRTIRICF